MPASLETLARELGDARIDGDPSVVVSDVQQDSRRLAPGQLFVARLGGGDPIAANARLAQFTRDAIAHGAAAILHEGDAPDGLALPTLRVPRGRLRAALGIAGSTVHGHPSFSVEVLAITGTNGKTTTTHLLADALDALAGAPSCGVIGTVGARLGERRWTTTHTTPEGDELARLLAAMRANGAKEAAIEASSHALHQERLAGTRVRAAGFTNLTQDHLDYHGTMEGYFEAKASLFFDLHPGASIVCVDDEWGRRLADGLGSNVLRVAARGGASAAADLRVPSVRYSASGIEAEIESPHGRTRLTSALLGAHNLENLLVALGILIALDVPLDRAAAALGSARPSAGRLELASDPAIDDVTVLVDYAHTPDALARVLATLRPLTAGRLVCVFGCGGDRDAKKRAPMGEAVASGADVGVVTSDNPRSERPESIVDAILRGMEASARVSPEAFAAGGRGVLVEVDRAAAIALSIAGAQAGDVVLIAGKGHEDYQIVGDERRAFDDRNEAMAALAVRRAKRRERGEAGAKLAPSSEVSDGTVTARPSPKRGA
jgi:UDP-N-acetylmuramoyl-L-alanyl-D-glutamate--2,6-diaminopimelate ligase